MRKIGIVGMGKMGKEIEAILITRNDLAYEPFSRLNPGNLETLQSCDVVIEFTTPEAAPEVISHCLKSGKAVVSGTTGWHEKHLERIAQECKQQNGKLLYATNYSIGMNIVFALNRKLANLMIRYPSFNPSLREVHHVHKKDSPSGTAYTLLDGLYQNYPGLHGFQLNPETPGSSESIPVYAIREGEVKGYHEVNWTTDKERIFIGHEAFDRSIFAEGAIMAAEWLVGQSGGVYTMRDIITL